MKNRRLFNEYLFIYIVNRLLLSSKIYLASYLTNKLEIAKKIYSDSLKIKNLYDMLHIVFFF